jgi:hypothetical protein
MKEWTMRQLSDRVRQWRNQGKCDQFKEVLVAAIMGKLWEVDTNRDGQDCLVIDDSADAALGEVAIHYDTDRSSAHPEGQAEWARKRGWSAEQIALKKVGE